MDFEEMRGAMNRALNGDEAEKLTQMWNDWRMERDLGQDLYRVLSRMFVDGRVAEQDVPAVYQALTNYERSHA